MEEAPQSSPNTQIISNVYGTALLTFIGVTAVVFAGHCILQEDFGISLTNLILIVQDREGSVSHVPTHGKSSRREVW